MTSCNALVLLGYSNTGKDTIARKLSEKFAGVTNAKFSALTKQMIADLWSVPVSFLEDRQWRENTPYPLNGKDLYVTPMDLLTALYLGAPDTALSSANIDWTLKNIGKSFPVFTDIRRLNEFQAVESHFNPYVVFLTRQDNEPGINDGEIAKVFKYASHSTRCETNVIHINKEETPEQTFDRLLATFALVNINLNVRPTLHIYVHKDWRRASNFLAGGRIPNYEPLAQLAYSIAQLTCNYGLDRSTFESMFQIAVWNLNWAEVTLPEITCESEMAWNPAHVHILDQLRAKANLKVHILDETMTQYAYDTFLLKEIN